LETQAVFDGFVANGHGGIGRELDLEKF